MHIQKQAISSYQIQEGRLLYDYLIFGQVDNKLTFRIFYIDREWAQVLRFNTILMPILRRR